MVISEDAWNRFREAAVDNRITCSLCFKIADEFDLDRSEIASTLTEMGIKIVNCQLGCFP